MLLNLKINIVFFDAAAALTLAGSKRAGTILHLVLCVDVGLAVEQQPRHLEVTVLSRHDQGGVAVLRVRGGAALAGSAGQEHGSNT